MEEHEAGMGSKHCWPPLLPLSVNPYPPLPNICLHVPSRALHWQYMFTYIILLRVSYSSLEARNIVPIFR